MSLTRTSLLQLLADDGFHLGPADPASMRVAVAMSGGVDSSLCAAILSLLGYDVVGLTMQLYPAGGTHTGKTCCAGRDILDARATAARFGFAHYVLDYESRFRADIIDDFADNYLAGRTPVPCIRCNQSVKFRDLIAQARALGAQCLVSGHYGRRVAGAGGVELHCAADAQKDQSYFLFATTAEQLAYVRFPLGGISKRATRDLARAIGLPVAEKPDSQDICFVPDGDYAGLLRKLRPQGFADGDIVDTSNRVLGRHRGIAHYTIGQRRGLGIGGRSAHSEPLYVVALDAARNRVMVGPRDALACSQMVIADINDLGLADYIDTPAGAAFDNMAGCAAGALRARFRSTMSAVPVTLHTLRRGEVGYGDGGRLVVRFVDDQFGVSPGQACVLYCGSRVVGGGWIAGEHRSRFTGFAAAPVPKSAGDGRVAEF